jgi:hypothetical protein
VNTSGVTLVTNVAPVAVKDVLYEKPALPTCTNDNPSGAHDNPELPVVLIVKYETDGNVVPVQSTFEMTPVPLEIIAAPSSFMDADNVVLETVPLLEKVRPKLFETNDKVETPPRYMNFPSADMLQVLRYDVIDAVPTSDIVVHENPALIET